ncbi:MAG: hypothetical protein A2Y12_00530 [Planctomycetes bacterium GWF2_42_9]|nr:MAG: hypothetical protein A2Y12_00530 [Planctomycetes bacterium GWF2_42_9]
MARIILRAGRIIVKIIVPLVVLSLILYSAYLLAFAKAENTQTPSTENFSLKKPVWTESENQRDKNTRIWQITKWQEEIAPETNEPNMVAVKSNVVEKGCGICYKDSNNQWQITDTSWRQTANGFVMDKANYALEIGQAANSTLIYTIDGEVVNLKASSIKIREGLNEIILATVTDAVCHIDPDNKSKLIYSNGFGDGIDLEIEAQADGFHQNVIFRNKPVLPVDLNSKNAEIKLYTEIVIHSTGSGQAEIPITTKSKDNIEFGSHRFVESKILQNSNGKMLSFAEADKQLKEENGNTFLIESLKFSELEEANYPVVWDYQNKSGTLNSEEWYADATYYIVDNITMTSGAELKIEPGTVIKFNNSKSINAESGKLTAQGRPYEYIVFTTKNDDTIGELISGSNHNPAAGDWNGLYINYDSNIEFCKMAYCVNGIVSEIFETGDLTIKNNIIYNTGFFGIYVNAQPEEGSINNICIINNLIDNVIDCAGIAVDVTDWCYGEGNLDIDLLINNNTIKTATNNIYDYTIGISVNNYLYANLSAVIQNNLIYTAYCGIYAGSENGITEQNNAFGQCTYNVQGATESSTDKDLTASPFDTTNTILGSYFLNSYGDSTLVNQGYGNTSDYYEPGKWTIHHVKATDGRLIVSPTSLTADTTWQPTADVDTGTVDIGYHHPRVDYCIYDEYGVDLDGYDLTIYPGTVIAMGIEQSGHWGLTLYDEGSEINCSGIAGEDGKIKFVYTPLASAKRMNCQFVCDGPTIEIAGQNTNDSKFEFTDFIGVRLSVWNDQSSGIQFENPIHDCLFKYAGMFVDNADLNIINSIFECCGLAAFTFDNWLYGGDVGIVNCNFDRNEIGVCLFNDAEIDTYLNVRNCIFSNNSTGVYYEGGDLTGNYNAFFENDDDIDGASYGDNDLYGTAIDEYDFYNEWEDFGDRFYLPQDSALVDSGDENDEPMWGHTTDPERAIIDDEEHVPVDIGYHYIGQREYWVKASNTQSPRTGSDTNPFNSIEEMQANTHCEWDVIHIVTIGETDTQLTTLFEMKNWPVKEYYSHEVYRNGIKWTFDDEYRIGQFCNGDFWVYGDGTVVIDEVSPTSTGSGASFRNGSMINPVAADNQAYDGRATSFNSSIAIGSAYSPRNFPLTLESGKSFISTASIIDQTTDEGCSGLYRDVSGTCISDASVAYLYSAAVLTTVPSLPPADAFRPPYSGTQKPFFTKAELEPQKELLPRLPLPTKPNITKLNFVKNEFQNVWVDHQDVWQCRYIHPVKNMPNYGREIGGAVSDASCLLMLDYDYTDLEPLLVNFIQTGIDFYYAHNNGTSWWGDGGHHNSRRWPIIFAGLLLDNVDMQNTGKTVLFGSEDSQTYYSTNEAYNPNEKALWGSDCYNPAYSCTTDTGGGTKSCKDPDELVDGCYRYRNDCTSPAWVGEAIAMKLIGAKDLWNHDAFFDYIQRWMEWDVDTSNNFYCLIKTNCDNLVQDMWNNTWYDEVIVDGIVDNGHIGTYSTKTWQPSGAANPFGDSSLIGSEGATYTWRYAPETTGIYKISMWWTVTENRSDQIPVEIQHSGGTATSTINQKQGANQWNNLGEYTLNAGVEYSVTITAPDQNPTTFLPSTCADAVKFTRMHTFIDSISPYPIANSGQIVYFSGSGVDVTILQYKWESNLDGVIGTTASFNTNSLSEGTHLITFSIRDNSGWLEPATRNLIIGPTIIDNGDPGTSYTGTWGVSGASGGFLPPNGNSLWARDGATYTWTYSSPETGYYDVSMWWTYYGTRADNIPVDITDDFGTTRVYINQLDQQKTGQWNSQGTYHFTMGNNYTVTITAVNGTQYSTCADAVKFELN